MIQLVPLSELFFSFQELVQKVFSAMRAIAGNDDVKDAVVNAGGVQLIVIAMNRHMSNTAVSCQVYIINFCCFPFLFVFVLPQKLSF